MKETRPELYAKLKEANKVAIRETKGNGKMIDFPAIDAMIEKRCYPIYFVAISTTQPFL